MKDIEIPKYMVKKLESISNKSNEIGKLLKEFEEWVKSKTDDEFSIGLLRAIEDPYEYEQTEALTIIEYGGFDLNTVQDMERIINLYNENKCKKSI